MNPRTAWKPKLRRAVFLAIAVTVGLLAMEVVDRAEERFGPWPRMAIGAGYSVSLAGLAFFVAAAVVSVLTAGKRGRGARGSWRTPREIDARLDALRHLVERDPSPHVSTIYEALDDDLEDADDVIGELTELTDRFAAGMIGAEEYDRTLRAYLNLPGSGLPVR